MKKPNCRLFQKSNSSLQSGSLLGASSACGVSHDFLIPQDFENASSNLPTHEGNALAFSRSLRAFHYNQQDVKTTFSFNRAKIKRSKGIHFRMTSLLYYKFIAIN